MSPFHLRMAFRIPSWTSFQPYSFNYKVPRSKTFPMLPALYQITRKIFGWHFRQCIIKTVFTLKIVAVLYWETMSWRVTMWCLMSTMPALGLRKVLATLPIWSRPHSLQLHQQPLQLQCLLLLLQVHGRRQRWHNQTAACRRWLSPLSY